MNLFAATLKRLGIECICCGTQTCRLKKSWYRRRLSSIQSFVFGETLANPALTVLILKTGVELPRKITFRLLWIIHLPRPIYANPYNLGRGYCHSLNIQVFGWTCAKWWGCTDNGKILTGRMGNSRLPNRMMDIMESFIRRIWKHGLYNQGQNAADEGSRRLSGNPFFFLVKPLVL